MKKALSDLVFIGVVQDKVKVFNKEWEMKTLTAQEHLEATSATADYDTLSRIYALKVEMLARSIKSVDDEPFEDKFEARSVLKEMQAPIVNKLYEEFEKLQDKQQDSLKDIQELKN